MEQLVERLGSTNRPNGNLHVLGETHETSSGRLKDSRNLPDSRAITLSWNADATVHEDNNRGYRIALGRHLEFSTRLAFAEIWHERAVKYGDTYRFNVVDQTIGEERKISELDVHRRAAARAQRIDSRDRAVREDAYETDLSVTETPRSIDGGARGQIGSAWKKMALALCAEPYPKLSKV